MISAKELINQGNNLFEKLKKLDLHYDQEHSLTDLEYTQELITEFERLEDNTPLLKTPNDLEELYLMELKRVCKQQSTALKTDLSTTIQTPEEIMEIYGITNAHIEKIKDWVLENKEKVIQANRNQLESSNTERGHLYIGSPIMRHKAEELMTKKIGNLKEFLTKELGDYPGTKRFLETYEISPEGERKRSFINSINKFVCLDTQRCVYITNRNFYINADSFIRIFGHEVFGHGLNFVNTEDSELPLFIKNNQYRSTSTVKESIAQHFENKFIDKLFSSKDYAKIVCAPEEPEITKNRIENAKLIKKYKVYMARIGIWILSQSKKDQGEIQIAELLKYSIENPWPARFVKQHQTKWNNTTGLLLPEVVSELRYCLDTATEIAKNNEESMELDKRMLTGFWTPQGFEDWISCTLVNKGV